VCGGGKEKGNGGRGSGPCVWWGKRVTKKRKKKLGEGIISTIYVNATQNLN
jgi:hypothetical protein